MDQSVHEAGQLLVKTSGILHSATGTQNESQRSRVQLGVDASGGEATPNTVLSINISEEESFLDGERFIRQTIMNGDATYAVLGER